MNKTIKLAFEGEFVAVVTLSRPEARNAINSQMARELVEMFANLPSKIRCVVLTGKGEKAFCAGADLKERNGMVSSDFEQQHLLFRKSLLSIINCPVPVIAAVGGAAFGGGLELAMAADFIYASENARFAMPEVTLGIMAGMGGTQNLPRAIHQRLAKELLYTGKVFSADDAEKFGLVNAVFAIDDLLEEALRTAHKIAENAPLSVRAVKETIASSLHLPIEEGLAIESEHYKPLLASKDRREGISAFNEKRKAIFTGE